MDPKSSKLKKILLTCPSYGPVYRNTIFQAGTYPPSLSLAAIAGALIRQGHDVRILDLNKHSRTELVNLIKSFSPGYLGVSFSTPLAEEAYLLAGLAKKIKGDIIVIAGGAHPSALPAEVLGSPDIDMVCVGESDYSVAEAVTKDPAALAEGIACKDKCGGGILYKEKNRFIEELDDLPFPAWDLFEIKEYKTNRFIARANPAGFIETSRGCPYGCIFCNKRVFGRNFRAKSVKRVVEEMGYMLSCGFRELHIVDDCFSFDIERAKGICAEILKRKIKFPWVTSNGIRADRVDKELLTMMKRAGCYRVCYGIESGDDAILALVQKGETLEEIRKAVKMSRENGLEVVGFFMLGLPAETKETMQKTIDFARELDLDFAKASITIPFPATPYFEELDNNGRIKTARRSKFNTHFIPGGLYDHPTLSWRIIEDYYRRFYLKFYLRPAFILKRFIKNIFRIYFCHKRG